MRRNAVAGRCIVHRSVPLVCTGTLGVPFFPSVNFVLQYEEERILDVVMFVTGEMIRMCAG